MQQAIFTIDARENNFLEVIESYFDVTQEDMFNEINGLFSQLLGVLALKKIKYQDLKSALIPQLNRNELALVFDSTVIESSWYGYDVFSQVIPLFHRKGTHSVLCGDYIGENYLQEKLYQMFRHSVELQKGYEYKHSSQFFVVYINNLSNQMVSDFKDGLANYEPYIGSIDLNLSSHMKTYLSTILINCFIKNRGMVISGHEDDRINEENVNMGGYPFEENDYSCRSLQSTLFDVFLSYKIERKVYPGFEADARLSVNAVSKTVIPISDCQIHIEENKFQYLLEEKTGKMKKAGLINLTRVEVEQLIREKIESNYVYNLNYLEEHNVVKFNILIETSAQDIVEAVKLNIALEYLPDEKKLRLITMF